MGRLGNGFADRREAGRVLGERLAREGLAAPIVLALPRGGVPVGLEVAAVLGAPLDVFVVRKLGAPGNPEFGFGAVAEGGRRVVDLRSARALGLSDADIDRIVDLQDGQVRRRVKQYRGRRALPSLQGRTVILVDDGLATGSTARAALATLRAREPAPRRLILAIPVGAADTVRRLSQHADEVICLFSSDDFGSVSTWYRDFTQITDDEVKQMLGR